MKVLQLRKIEKLYFGYEEIARTLSISLSSARVVVSRYVKAGFLIRLKRNLYVLHEKWAAMSLEQKFIIANLMQVPSYVSFMTALNYYEITTQLQQDFIESVAVKRSNEIAVENTIFHYVKMKPELYFGFTRTQGFFIADPEKALVDALYLQSLGRHSLDVSSIDFQRLNRSKVFQFARSFPKRTQRLVEKYEYSFTA